MKVPVKKMRTNQKKRRDGLGVVQLNIEIPDNLHRGLKVVAAADRVSIRKVAEDALASFYQQRKTALKLPFNWAASADCQPLAV